MRIDASDIVKRQGTMQTVINTCAIDAMDSINIKFLFIQPGPSGCKAVFSLTMLNTKMKL